MTTHDTDVAPYDNDRAPSGSRAASSAAPPTPDALSNNAPHSSHFRPPTKTHRINSHDNYPDAAGKVICFIGKLGGWSPGILPKSGSLLQSFPSSLDCPAFIAAHRQQPQDFTRPRQLTFKNLILFLLNQPRTTLQTDLDQFYRVLNRASAESQVVTTQAFSKARSKLKPEVFESLNQAVQKQIDSLGLRRTWRGLRVLAVDGSTVHLPLEPAMTRFFGSHSGFPVARLSMLYDVADGQTLHSLIVPAEIAPTCTLRMRPLTA